MLLPSHLHLQLYIPIGHIVVIVVIGIRYVAGIVGLSGDNYLCGVVAALAIHLVVLRVINVTAVL